MSICENSYVTLELCHWPLLELEISCTSSMKDFTELSWFVFQVTVGSKLKLMLDSLQYTDVLGIDIILTLIIGLPVFIFLLCCVILMCIIIVVPRRRSNATKRKLLAEIRELQFTLPIDGNKRSKDIIFKMIICHDK